MADGDRGQEQSEFHWRPTVKSGIHKPKKMLIDNEQSIRISILALKSDATLDNSSLQRIQTRLGW